MPIYMPKSVRIAVEVAEQVDQVRKGKKTARQATHDTAKKVALMVLLPFVALH